MCFSIYFGPSDQALPKSVQLYTEICLVLSLLLLLFEIILFLMENQTLPWIALQPGKISQNTLRKICEI